MVTRNIKIKIPDNDCCDDCNYMKYMDSYSGYCNIFFTTLEKDEDRDVFLPCDECLDNN